MKKLKCSSNSFLLISTCLKMIVKAVTLLIVLIVVIEIYLLKQRNASLDCKQTMISYL